MAYRPARTGPELCCRPGGGAFFLYRAVVILILLREPLTGTTVHTFPGTCGHLKAWFSQYRYMSRLCGLGAILGLFRLTSEGFVGSNPTAPTIAHQHKRAVWTARSEGLLSWPVVENKASSLRAAAALRVAGLCLCEAEQRRCGASHRALRAASQERGLGFGPRPWPGLARSVPARMVRVMLVQDLRAARHRQPVPGDLGRGRCGR
jgi:hypothetical protein